MRQREALSNPLTIRGLGAPSEVLIGTKLRQGAPGNTLFVTHLVYLAAFGGARGDTPAEAAQRPNQWQKASSCLFLAPMTQHAGLVSGLVYSYEYVPTYRGSVPCTCHSSWPLTGRYKNIRQPDSALVLI